MRHSKQVITSSAVTVTTHSWDGQDIVLDVSANGTTKAKYLRASTGLVAQIIGNDTSWYIHNAHGDVVQRVDGSGNVLKTYNYDSFGNILNPAVVGNPSLYVDQSPFGYCGEYLDKETGELYLRARYCDSTAGRFTAEDPQRDNQNWYSYCGGDPVNRTDPSGKSLQSWWESTKEKVSSTYSRAKTSVANWYNSNRATIKVVAAVATVLLVTVAVVATAGLAVTALGLVGTSAVFNGMIVGAITGSLLAGGVNIVAQALTKGTDNISLGEVALSTAVGGVTGTISGGFAGMSVPTTAATQLLVQKGFQAGANALLSGGAYLLQSALSGKQPTLYGYTVSTVGGFIFGATFDFPFWKAFGVSSSVELATYGEDFFGWLKELFKSPPKPQPQN